LFKGWSLYFNAKHQGSYPRPAKQADIHYGKASGGPKV